MNVDSRHLLAVLFAQRGDRIRGLVPRSEEGWRALQRRCETLDATGLLHAALRRTRAGDLAPADVRAAVRLAHGSNAAQNLALCVEAERVLKALEAAGVLATPMKGVALFRERVVEDLGARPTGDFDLVTRRADRDLALRTLRDLGYAPRFDEVSWKHLPAVTRDDLSIEVHEIAYWSPATRAVFGADHLAVADRPTRIGRLAALQIHHLVLGSPPDAALALRTFGDLDAFFQLARGDDAVARALVAAAQDAGIVPELAAADSILAEARGEAPVLGPQEGRAPEPGSEPWVADTNAARERLLSRLEATPTDPRGAILAHALRIAPVQPWRVTWEMMSLLVFPPREHVAARLGASADSPAITLARMRRPFELTARLVRSLRTALRVRPGARARSR